MQQIYTIPINEAFDASAEDKSCGCPMCALYRMLEENALDTAMGGSMMEPSVRISMNEEGFCKIHYDMLFEMKNRLGMALTLESHLNELKDDLSPKGLASLMPKNTASKIERLENSCYICSRVDGHFNMMIDIVVSLWKKDEQFPKKLKCWISLPHPWCSTREEPSPPASVLCGLISEMELRETMSGPLFMVRERAIGKRKWQNFLPNSDNPHNGDLLKIITRRLL